MTEPEIIAALPLQNIPNIGDGTGKKIIVHCGSPSAIFEDKLCPLFFNRWPWKDDLKGSVR
ncbi:MAG: hypothetical protein NXH90_03355 [Flavobacteriaceae bacterium]|nr:hypothetical protein [Flavobacteriaceae bacterium]